MSNPHASMALHTVRMSCLAESITYWRNPSRVRYFASSGIQDCYQEPENPHCTKWNKTPCTLSMLTASKFLYLGSFGGYWVWCGTFLGTLLGEIFPFGLFVFLVYPFKSSSKNISNKSVNWILKLIWFHLIRRYQTSDIITFKIKYCMKICQLIKNEIHNKDWLFK